MKQRVTIRLDKEVIDFFKTAAKGRGYQSLINEILYKIVKEKVNEKKEK